MIVLKIDKISEQMLCNAKCEMRMVNMNMETVKSLRKVGSQ
jgi:hypothetical protein